MRVNVSSGGADGFDAIIYGAPSKNTLDYLQSNISEVYNAVGQAGAAFVDKAKGIYDRFNSSQALHNMKSLIYSAGTHVNGNVILPLDINNPYNINDAGKRYMMINPVIHELNTRQQISAYDDNYFSIEKSFDNLEENIDYMDVMNGANEDVLTFYTYGDVEGHEPLDDFDQMTVRDSWDDAEYWIEKGIDPTSEDYEEI